MPVTINGSTGLTGVAAIDSVSSTELGYLDGLSEPLSTSLAAKAANPNFALLNAGGTPLTGAATITVSGISGKNQLFLWLDAGSSASASSYFGIRLNGDTGNNYQYAWVGRLGTALNQSIGPNSWYFLTRLGDLASVTASAFALVSGCNGTGYKPIVTSSYSNGSNTNMAGSSVGAWTGNSTVTSISVFSDTGNFDAGTLYVYGA